MFTRMLWMGEWYFLWHSLERKIFNKRSLCFLFRFQILRELIPHSEQKRDTASFLLEVCYFMWTILLQFSKSSFVFPLLIILVFMQVIQYVQFLQKKVQKYEGSYQAWNSETTKLMPWVNYFSACRNFHVLEFLLIIMRLLLHTSSIYGFNLSNIEYGCNYLWDLVNLISKDHIFYF